MTVHTKVTVRSSARASRKAARRDVVTARGRRRLEPVASNPKAHSPTLILDSEAALAEGLAALVATDPVIAALVANGATPALRKRPPGFQGLAGVVIAQQLSVASAAAIWGRLCTVLDPFHAGAVSAASDESLRAAGLSAAKIRTLRAIAEAVACETLPLDELAVSSPDAARAALTAIRGIGPWTADIYLLFCLGHPDILPAGDLAVQEAARHALGLRKRPDEKRMRKIAERWRPWRGVAALVLWSHYRLLRRRDGVLATGLLPAPPVPRS